MNKYLKFSGLILLIGLAGLIVYASLAPKPVHEKPQIKKVSQEIPVPAARPIMETHYWHDEEVQVGDDLPFLLNRIGVNPQSIQNLMQDNPSDLKTIRLRAGQIISVNIHSNHDISDLQFFRDDDNGERNLVAIEYKDGKWQLHSGVVDAETVATLRSVEITSSVSGALAKAGVPVEIRTSLQEIFADKIPLDQLTAGDKIRVLYESLYFRGQEVATGNILAAEISTASQTYYAYYFEHGDAGGNFYDEQLNPLTQGFTGLPIEHYTRISSPYGIRIHPVLRTIKMHTGIDYAAPTGTKILAPSDGVVSFRGWKGGYGNTVMLSHRDGLETLYGHMSSFISGVDVGTSVKAGDVIGLVGSTGRSTGSHLHYEVRINGQHVNPATITLPAPELTDQDRAALKQYQNTILSLMQSVRDIDVMIAQQD
ncbi:M23 family metallopeptidase [Kingella kingae]|uniref:M23 family metallopeptidase n=1 Tax=Kingella kingae TaxID=504 RepID=UPI0025544253|nr:M23 family metallopeptidase [Kingella kingae]MDK4653253.1 M23 family metallopeptidase [Kingella kingae]